MTQIAKALGAKCERASKIDRIMYLCLRGAERVQSEDERHQREAEDGQRQLGPGRPQVLVQYLVGVGTDAHGRQIVRLLGHFSFSAQQKSKHATISPNCCEIHVRPVENSHPLNAENFKKYSQGRRALLALRVEGAGDPRGPACPRCNLRQPLLCSQPSHRPPGKEPSVVVVCACVSSPSYCMPRAHSAGSQRQRTEREREREREPLRKINSMQHARQPRRLRLPPPRHQRHSLSRRRRRRPPLD